MQLEMDRNDVRILETLQQHGNLSAAEVAEKVGLTSAWHCWTGRRSG
jgi:DNA-binding Lrp family transcriptional regulator